MHGGTRSVGVGGLVCLLGWAAAGCGAGVPLLHGAHVLSPGSLSMATGMSSRVVTGGSGRARIEDARNLEGIQPGASVDSETQRFRAAAAVLALGPGTAPVVSARMGLPDDNEAGLSYTGQWLRLDARHMFDLGDVALSMGAGVRVRSSWAHDEPYDFGVSPSAFIAPGFDLPLLLGWRSRSEIITLWAGARASYWSSSGEISLGGPNGNSSRRSFQLKAWQFGAVAGLSAGFRHVHVVMELDADYTYVDGSLDNSPASVKGVALTPASALVFSF